MTTKVRAIRLALIVEAVSCLGMVYQSNPVSIWNSWCISLGWPTGVISDVLLLFFGAVHTPVLLLLHLARGDVGFMIYNGRLTPTSIWLIIAMFVQCALWSLIFFGLLSLERKLRARFRHHAVLAD